MPVSGPGKSRQEHSDGFLPFRPSPRAAQGVKPAMESWNQMPITVMVVIESPQGSYTVSKTQQFGRRPNAGPGTRPLQSMSQLWKEACADVNPYIRRHDTVNG